MKLLPVGRLTLEKSHLVFRHSRRRAGLVGLLCLAAGAGALWIGWRREAPLALYLAGVLAFGLLVLRKLIVARFRDSNWLVRVTDTGLLIQFRSYLNQHLPPDHVTVLLLPYSEIARARQVVERRERPDRESDGRSSGSFITTYRWLSLTVHPRVDLAGLSKALDAEVARRPRSGALYKDYPVRLSSPEGAVLVRWAVTPSLDVLLDALADRGVAIAAGGSEFHDDTSLLALPPDAQHRRLVELVRAGDTMTAIHWARSLYGYDLTQARTFVEQLVAPADREAASAVADGRRDPHES